MPVRGKGAQKPVSKGTRESRRERLSSRLLAVLQRGRETPVRQRGAGRHAHRLLQRPQCVGTDRRSIRIGRRGHRRDRRRHRSVAGGRPALRRPGGDSRPRRLERASGLLPVPVAGLSRSHGWHGNLLLFRDGTVRDVHQISAAGRRAPGCAGRRHGTGRRPVAHRHRPSGLLRRSRAQQAEAILDGGRHASETPTLILGDLNEWRLGARSSLLEFRSRLRAADRGLAELPVAVSALRPRPHPGEPARL